jgi:hypothetical protein
MRRAHGARTPSTIDTYKLLAQLYTSTALEIQAKAPPGKIAPLAQDYFKQAFSVHEDILRLLVHGQGQGSSDDDSDDELDNAAALLKKEGVNSTINGDVKQIDTLDEENIDFSAVALRHLNLWKMAYQRLGNWPKSSDEYQRLNTQVFHLFGGEVEWKGIQGIEKWSAKEFGFGKAESREGEFEGVGDWGFGSEMMILHTEQNGASNEF